ncbi:VanW family protein [Polymorphospora rubra]|uniref:Vanomycin resistance protein VanB n=1 Tax=Polymorphospora rubra TaxID=338584 RepID=A0A810N973_9ACTN|nr:VanW family protein [Polymorphospora rubra]BCJ69956.1 vanomycin resistance protein VanB [Polymorphospora rubra]
MQPDDARRTDVSTAPPPAPAGRPSSRRRALVAAALAGAVLLPVGAAVGYAYTGEVPRGVTVLGVGLGGLGRAAAGEALRAELDRRAADLAAPVTVRVEDGTARVDPSAVGLAVDVDATVAAAVDARPGLFARLFGGATVDPVVTVDQGRLDAVLREAVGDVGQPVVAPAITYDGTTPRPVYPESGRVLDPATAADVLRAGWPAGREVTVPLLDVHPATTAADVDRLLTELAEPAVSGPVTVTTERGDVVVPPAAIAKSLVLAADDVGRIEPRIDEKELRSALGNGLREVEVAPKDATVVLDAGKPKVVSGVDGQRLDTAALGRDLLAVLPRTADRRVAGVLAVAPPAMTDEQVAAFGIRERVSTFTTNFTGGLSAARSHNIVTIARDVDGTIVKPGETFSLNGHTGERSYKQGYRDAPVIMDGKLVPGVGGGTSQFTTTLFNATYYAGLEDVEHKPHSYWFSRYPAVIESTIFYPNLDFKFRNDTPYGLLIDTSWTNDSITVSIWSTRIYDSVKTEWSPRRNITKPRVVHLEPGPSCIATDGIDGFTQDAWRIFHKDGKELRREKFSWRYDAEPRFICGS